MFYERSRGKIWFGRNLRFAAQESVSDEFGCANRSSNAKAVMAGGGVNVFKSQDLTDEGQIVRSRRPKAGPNAHGRKLGQPRLECESAGRHSAKSFAIDLTGFCVELPR